MLFVFSSRRRHTRSLCDWSSDVCSSDLDAPEDDQPRLVLADWLEERNGPTDADRAALIRAQCELAGSEGRSEERRVGKECRWRGEPDQSNKRSGGRRQNTSCQ